MGEAIGTKLKFQPKIYNAIRFPHSNQTRQQLFSNPARLETTPPLSTTFSISPSSIQQQHRPPFSSLPLIAHSYLWIPVTFLLYLSSVIRILTYICFLHQQTSTCKTVTLKTVFVIHHSQHQSSCTHYYVTLYSPLLRCVSPTTSPIHTHLLPYPLF